MNTHTDARPAPNATASLRSTSRTHANPQSSRGRASTAQFKRPIVCFTTPLPSPLLSSTPTHTHQQEPQFSALYPNRARSPPKSPSPELLNHSPAGNKPKSPSGASLGSPDSYDRNATGSSGFSKHAPPYHRTRSQEKRMKELQGRKAV